MLLIQISRLRQTNFIISFCALSLKTDTSQFKEVFKHVLDFKHISNPIEVALRSIHKSHY